MGVVGGGYSYVDQQRNLNVRMSKEELMRSVKAGHVDPDIAAEALQEAEDDRVDKARRNRGM